MAKSGNGNSLLGNGGKDPNEKRYSYNDVLAALLSGSQFGPQAGGNDLSAFLNMPSIERTDLPTQPGEQESVIDPMERMGQFRNQAYAPHASGVPYIFTGGSPFPQTAGQQRAEKVFATGALLSNLMGNKNLTQGVSSGLMALIDAIRRRRQGGQ